MADKTKLYQVPGKKGYGISEAALKRKAAEEIQEPDTSKDLGRRIGATVSDIAALSPFALQSQRDKFGNLNSVNDAIKNRTAAYENKIAEQNALKEALQNKKEVSNYDDLTDMQYKKGGKVKSKKQVNNVKKPAAKPSSASKRADGCAQRGKTKGKYI